MNVRRDNWFVHWRASALLVVLAGRGTARLALALVLAVGAIAFVGSAGADVSGVTVSVNSTTAGDLAATWTFKFTTSASGALGSTDRVTITFPAGIDVSGANGAVFGSGFAGSCSAPPPPSIATGQSVEVDLTGTCTLPASTQGTITMTGISPSAGTYPASGFTVATDVETTPLAATGSDIVISGGGPTAVSAVGFTPVSPLGGATTDWTVGFTSSSTGSLAGGAGFGYVLVTYPAGFTIPAPTLAATLGSGFAGTCSGVIGQNVGGQTIELDLPTGCTLAASTAASLTINGVDNPGTAGNYSGASVSTSADFTAVAPASNITITSASTFTVHFDPNGGSGSTSDETFTGGVAQALTANAFTRTSYTFTGWNTATDGTGTNYSNGQSITITADLTLHARWTAVPTVAGVAPATGVAGIATTVTLTGTSFGAATSDISSVTYGPAGTGSGCANVAWVSSTVLTCTVGADIAAGVSVKFIATTRGVPSTSSTATYTATAPASCNEGDYMSDGRCIAAPAGTFVSAGGATSPTPCATGTFSATAGATSCTAAIVCASGQTQTAAATATTDTVCAAGAVDTATTLVLPHATARVGKEDTVTFTVTVTGASETLAQPFGTVNVENGGTELCAAALNSRGVGTCNLTASQLPAGTYSSINASYPGATGFNASESATTTFRVSPAPAGSAAALVFTSPTKATFTIGKRSRFTITASGSGPAPAITLGNESALPAGVFFVKGNGTATLEGTPTSAPEDGTGQGAYVLALTAQGPKGIVTQILTVAVQSATTMALRLSKSTVMVGKENVETFTVTVKAASGPLAKPFATVNLENGKTTLCVAILDFSGVGTCSLTASQLPVGTYSSINASYPGATGFNASNSGNLKLTVSRAVGHTTTTLGLSSGIAVVGNEDVEKFTVAVKATGEATPSGTVKVQNGRTELCAAILDSSGVGTCSLTASQLPARTYTSIKAYYPGATGFNASRSHLAPLTITAGSAGIPSVAEVCSAGSYLDGSRCVPALAGWYVLSAGATSAKPCAAGTYSATPGSIGCSDAPAGSYVSTERAISATPCAAESFSKDSGSKTCTPCPPGKTTVGKPGSTGCASLKNIVSVSSDGLCVGDGSTTLLYCPVSGIPQITVTEELKYSGPSDEITVNGVAYPTTHASANVLTARIPAQPGSNTITVSVSGLPFDSRNSPAVSFRSNISAPILPPMITSLDSSTCLGRVMSGITTVGLTACPALGSSILINGKNFFYTTTVTPGLCSSLFYVTFFQLLCLLAPQPRGTVTYVQAFTPGMGETSPTTFSVTSLDPPTISSLSDAACTGTQLGFSLNGCPSVGGSTLTITGTNFLPSSTITGGLCSNVLFVSLNKLYCTLSSGIAPGTTVNVVVSTLAGTSSASGITISF